ncbi:MAG TPA: lipopolysaccharide biosynthesis protein [Rhodothermales bacterium]|nr:lipopolysaccharide biosynthesis protein [Rhodothermales bacterium]
MQPRQDSPAEPVAAPPAEEQPGAGFGARLKQLGSESLIYGLSAIVGRFLAFLLQPFYVSQFTTGENGIQTLVYSVIPLITVAFVLGLDVAYMRNAADVEKDPLRHRQQVFSMPFGMILVIGGALIGLGMLLVPTAQALLHVPRYAVLYLLLIVYTDALLTVPFAHLRMANQAKRYALLKVGFVIVSIILNVVLIVGLHWSVKAIFVANFVANLLMLTLLLPEILRLFRPRLLTRGIGWRALWAYALPIIPATFFVMVVEQADKLLLSGMPPEIAAARYGLTARQVVGVYGWNYKLGVLMLLVVQMFRMAWIPFSLNQGRDETAPLLFSRVLTGLMLVCSAVFLLVVLFLPVVVHIPAVYHFPREPAYWLGLPIVPVILLGYIFSGIYAVVTAGLYIRRKTGILPFVAGAGAFVNVLICIWGRSHAGMVVVAWATPAAYLLMSILAAWQSNRFYPVPYEWTRLIHIAAIVALLFFAGQWLGAQQLGFTPDVLVRLGLLAAFPVLLWATRFFRPGEWAALSQATARIGLPRR